MLTPSEREFLKGYRYAADYYDSEVTKQKAIDYLYVNSFDCIDKTQFDRGVIEFLCYYNLKSSYETYY